VLVNDDIRRVKTLGVVVGKSGHGSNSTLQLPIFPSKLGKDILFGDIGIYTLNKLYLHCMHAYLILE
jgi:hypothetical protein